MSKFAKSAPIFNRTGKVSPSPVARDRATSLDHPPARADDSSIDSHPSDRIATTDHFPRFSLEHDGGSGDGVRRGGSGDHGGREPLALTHDRLCRYQREGVRLLDEHAPDSDLYRSADDESDALTALALAIGDRAGYDWSPPIEADEALTTRPVASVREGSVLYLLIPALGGEPGTAEIDREGWESIGLRPVVIDLGTID